MSLILEALKKSEQQRRLGEAPTLGSTAPSVRRRRSLLPVFLGLIVLAAAAGWWTMRTPPGPAGVTVATAPTAATPAATPAMPAAPPRATPAPGRPARPATPVAEASRPLAANTAAGAQAEAALHQAMLDKQAELAKRQAASRERLVTQAPAGAIPPTSTPGSASTPTLPPRPDVVLDTPPKRLDAPAAAPSTAAAAAPGVAAPVPQSAAQRAAAALPSLWELPYASRKNIPELKLTMHVYAPVPADRFVVIDGTRHVEGDDLGDGLVLKEIRADGMVLDYKGTHFVFPRDGG